MALSMADKKSDEFKFSLTSLKPDFMIMALRDLACIIKFPKIMAILKCFLDDLKSNSEQILESRLIKSKETCPARVSSNSINFDTNSFFLVAADSDFTCRKIIPACPTEEIISGTSSSRSGGATIGELISDALASACVPTGGVDVAFAGVLRVSTKSKKTSLILKI